MPASTPPGPEEVRFEGHGGDALRALWLASSAEKGSAVLLVHDVYGLDAHARAAARRFADEGFAVLAPDLYAREGAPPVTSAASEAEVRAALALLPDRRALGDLEGAARWLGARPEVDRRSVAVVGFGLGGTLAFLLGCTSARAACVVDVAGSPLHPELSVHQPSHPLDLHLNLDRPLLALFGERDGLVPAEHVALLRERLAMAGKEAEVVTLPGAARRFFDERSGEHERAASAAAWERMLAFLRATL